MQIAMLVHSRLKWPQLLPPRWLKWRSCLEPNGRARREFQSTDKYSDAYVHPSVYGVKLSACKSTVDGGTLLASPLRAARWSLEPLDGQVAPSVTATSSPHSCRNLVHVRALGRWRITLTVTDSAGSTASDTARRTFRDVLVVAVGDSMASGEGNKLDAWDDEQCDRSHAAWPEDVARRLEGASTTVTFLSFACSGASVSNVSDTNYEGQHPDGQQMLPPQLLAVRRALGDPRNPSTRPVNVLLGAVGMNELGVSDILIECSLKGGLGVHKCRRDPSGPLSRLSLRYEQLELALAANVRLGSAYFIGYPARIFTDALDHFARCGVFSRMALGDPPWVAETVTSLNGRLSTAADKYGWGFVPTTNMFRRHGYCADVAPPGTNGITWFRDRTSSINQQGNNDGTAHPNLQGHRAAGAAFAAVVSSTTAPPPPASFNVRFLRIRVTDPLHPLGKVSARLSVRTGYPSSCQHTTEPLPNLVSGVWADLRDKPCLSFPVRTAGNTVAVTADTVLPGLVTSRHGRTSVLLRRAQGWSATPAAGPQYVVRHMVGSSGGAHVEVDFEVTQNLVVEPTARR